MNKVGSTKTFFINLDLLFDFYSVFFSVYRTYFSRHSIHIDNLKHLIEGKSLKSGLYSLVEAIGGANDAFSVLEDSKTNLDFSLKTIKPVIGAATLLNEIHKQGHKVKIFTNFEEDVLFHIRESHKSWFPYEMIGVQSVADLYNEISLLNAINPVIIDSSFKSCVHFTQEEKIPSVFLLNSKSIKNHFEKDTQMKDELKKLDIKFGESFEDIDWTNLGFKEPISWPERSFFLQLDKTPKSDEYYHWNNVHKLPEEVVLTSKIVHGFGRGGKKLGIPTANLDMTSDIAEKLVDFVPGVYYGYAEFMKESSGDKSDSDIEFEEYIPMVMSIGFNPYFNNKHKTAEAHLMRNFKKDFYDKTLRVKVIGFIRTEADFVSFSNLVEAIHNDVQITKDLLATNDF